MILTDIIYQMAARVLFPRFCSALTGGTKGVGAVTVTGGGTGYTSAPTVSITGGGGTGATAVASVVSNQVASVSISAPGTGYSSTPTVGFSGGGGTGATGTATLYAITLDAILTPNLDLGSIVVISISNQAYFYQ